MEIQLATENSLLDIMYLLYKCVRDMNRKGMFQWNHAYPSMEVIENDIITKSLYTFNDNWIIKGIIVLNKVQPPEYEKIEWKFKDDNDPALIIHRLAVHPMFQNQGAGRRLMDFAIDYSRENGFGMIRLDVYEGNLSANQMYRKLGFSHAGRFRFPFQETEFICYEMKI